MVIDSETGEPLTNQDGESIFFTGSHPYLEGIFKGVNISKMGLYNYDAIIVRSATKLNGQVLSTVEEGKGTDMQHHWDEAFGYFGVPTDFPTNTEGLVGLGKYCNKVDAQLGCNKIIMDAFK